MKEPLKLQSADENRLWLDVYSAVLMKGGRPLIDGNYVTVAAFADAAVLDFRARAFIEPTGGTS